MKNVQWWNQNQQKDYILTTVEGFTEEQKLYMANVILNQYEDKKRMTEMQGDNQEPADEEIPER